MPCIRKHLLTGANLVVMAFAILPPAPAQAKAPATVVVSIDKFAFAPREITVAAGAVVVWSNHDQTPHTVMARDRSFSSTGLDTGDTYRYTFMRPGDYSYFCTMHPFMTGIVHVR